MINTDFVLDYLALTKSTFVDPIRAQRGDYRWEWMCCPGTEFHVSVLVDDVPVIWPTMGDRFLKTSSEIQKLEEDRVAVSDFATRRKAADAVAQAMGEWSAHKKLRLMAAVETAKRETECPTS